MSSILQIVSNSNKEFYVLDIDSDVDLWSSGCDRIESVMQFEDTWECHEYISENKMALLLPHIETYGENLKGFEFFCENRYD